VQNLSKVFAARSGIWAYLPVILVIISIFIGAAWLIFFPMSDPGHYQCYAMVFWLGSGATRLLPHDQCSFLQPSYTFPQLAFHILPIEYPPLTLLIFSPALLAPIPYYQFAFALSLSLVVLFVYWLLLRYGPRYSAPIFAFYLFIGAIATTHNRFDLVPAALTLASLIAAERKHWTTAHVALAFGVLMKIYPIALLPALFIAEQQVRGKLKFPDPMSTWRDVWRELLAALRSCRQWHWKNLLIALGIIVAVTGGFVLLDVQHAFLSQLSYFMLRPIQVEATGSTLLWLAQSVFPLKITFDFGSYNVQSALSSVVSPLSTLCLLAGFCWATWLQWRGKLDLAQAFIALVLLSVATGKVFSPQYLIWLMPLLAYAGAFDAIWLVLWGVVSLLTTFIYTFLYSRLVTVDANLLSSVPGFFEVVALRNALFALITLAYLLNWFHLRQRRPLPF
jgi:hypothetical protein